MCPWSNRPELNAWLTFSVCSQVLQCNDLIIWLCVLKQRHVQRFQDISRQGLELNTPGMACRSQVHVPKFQVHLLSQGAWLGISSPSQLNLWGQLDKMSSFLKQVKFFKRLSYTKSTVQIILSFHVKTTSWASKLSKLLVQVSNFNHR